MKPNSPLQRELEATIADFLFQQFGERPQAIHAFIRASFAVIHLIDFEIPSERLLLQRHEWKWVTKTRDLLFEGVKPELMEAVQQTIGCEIHNFYLDWNLEAGSGMLLFILDREADPALADSPPNVDSRALMEKVIQFSRRTQKEPDFIQLYWLNDQTALIERRGTLVDIEKELMKNGVTEELRLAKRSLEHRILAYIQLESLFNRDIHELFVDWNLEEDVAYMVFFLAPLPE